MKQQLTQLKDLLHQIYDLEMVEALLDWDQSTYMPKGGANARGRQKGLITKLLHQKKTDPEVGRLLDELEPWALAQPTDSVDAGVIRVARREFERAIKIPAKFAAEFSEHVAKCYQTWTTARPNNDFASVRDLLARTLDYSRQYANFFPGYEHVADPLIDVYDYGCKATDVRALFAELRTELVPLVAAICDQEPADDSVLHKNYPIADQRRFGEMVAADYGYDSSRGRQDETHHPFMTKFSLDDVRITTRFKPDDLSDGLFSTLHETGHAMYEQNIDNSYEGTPLATGTSFGVHESQSRLWENLVGRSRSFWAHYYPRLQEVFPEQLGQVPLDSFYRAINKVQRSLIRTDADEVTYNLQVMIRFELELELLEGKLSVADLPEAWHARYQSDLGLRAADDSDGVLQDIHWYFSYIGGSFQSYTLGNVMSAQFFAAASAANPGLSDAVGSGRFDELRTWLVDNIYRHGSRLTATEIVERSTGRPLSIAPYIDYLYKKYGELYDVPARP